MRNWLRYLQTVLFVVAIGNLAVLVWDLVTDGIHIKVFGHVVFSSWDIRRPSGAAAICGAIALWLRDRSAPTPTWALLPRWSRWIAAAIAVTATVVAVCFGNFVAGGADSYGYISEAHLWTTGRLEVRDALATLAPQLGPAVVPLGYRLAQTPGAIVPIYSPGLPLAMALAEKAAGAAAVYYVVPLLAGLTVWLTYVLAERSFDRRTALAACVGFASSPLFLFLILVEPMSDVPVTAWWLCAWVFALQPSMWAVFGAGLASAAAVMTRANIVVLAPVLALVVAGSRPRRRRLILFAAPVMTACLLIAGLNRALYGSPFESGYGSLGYLFQKERILENLQRYFGWLVEFHTPFILLAFVAPLVTCRLPDSSSCPPRPWRLMLIFSGILLSCYLPYFVFDNWTFLRFLLPAIPLLFILASLVIVRAIERLPVAFRAVCLIAICVAACLWYGFKAASLGLFGPERAEDRYQVVGEYVGRALPLNAVVLTVIQSGSIRWYGHRTTLRWDLVADERLDEAIGVLAAHGYEPYILLEDYEESSFRKHFARANIFGRIDWAPAIEYLSLGHVRLYAIADRARHLAGERILTHPILAPD